MLLWFLVARLLASPTVNSLAVLTSQGLLLRSGANGAEPTGTSILGDPQVAGGTRRLTRESLILSEDFDTFNLDLWKHEITMGGGGNWEFQVYGNNRTNSYVKDGKLFLQPSLTSDYLGAERVGGQVPTTFDIWGLVPADQCTSNMFYGCSRGSDLASRIAINPVMSARVRTAGTFSFRYGRFEARAKLPRGDWLWPAIWLLPEHNAYGQWPASGEIDIMESRGNDPSYAEDRAEIGGVDLSSSAIHWGPHYSMDSWPLTYGTRRLDGDTYNDDFHIFGLYWDDEQMYTYVDTEDNKVLTVKFGNEEGPGGFWEMGGFAERYPGVDNPWEGAEPSAPYDQRFYVVMNVAVGGVSGFFPDGVGGKMWENSDSDAAMKFHEATPEWHSTWNGKDSALQVDYVKVWQKEPDYFLDAAAAAAISRTAAKGKGSAGTAGLSAATGVQEGTRNHNTKGGGILPKFVVFAICAVCGALFGGFAVAWVLQKQNCRQRAGAYDTIGAAGDGSRRFEAN